MYNKISLDSRRHEFIKFNRYMTLKEYAEYIGSDVYNYITYEDGVCKLHLEVLVFDTDDLQGMEHDGCEVKVEGEGPFYITLTLSDKGYIQIDHLRWEWEKDEDMWLITNPYVMVKYDRGSFIEMVSEKEIEEYKNFLSTDIGKHITKTSRELFDDLYYREINFFKAMTMFLRKAN
jgi:hypothetical protein